MRYMRVAKLFDAPRTPPLDAARRAIQRARNRYSFDHHGLLAAPLAAVEVLADLSPVVRLRGLRRLPNTFRSGVVGAEIATWGAVSPSLLPRRWWTTAANVAICQAVGHMLGAGAGTIARAWGASGPRGKSANPARIAMSAITLAAYATSAGAHARQKTLVSTPHPVKRGETLIGLSVGTLGYGAMLLVGEILQTSVDHVNAVFGRKLPPVTSWPLAILAVAGGAYVFADRLVVRNLMSTVYKQAEELNREFFSGAPQPREPQRSGSPSSVEAWDTMGRQGRAVVAGGPRARDIARVLDVPREAVTEPIRIFIGLRDGERNRSYEGMAEAALREMDRTNAWERAHIAVMSSAGTGWINDFHTSGFEFVARGNCAVVAMQYSYVPSLYSYLADRESAVQSSRLLINAIRKRIAALDTPNPPKLYVGGESLGAYGVADAFQDPGDFLARTSGGVFTGAPGFCSTHTMLTRRREPGSPQRLPVVDGGRHFRFIAHPDHLEHDFAGKPYDAEWEFPRAVFAQHASDPVVWWDAPLLWRAPDWLKEPGSRGVPAPAAQHLDVLHTLRWWPFVTFWQVGIDQVSSNEYDAPHGHNYHEETVAAWNKVLDGGLTQAELSRVNRWIHADSTKLRA